MEGPLALMCFIVICLAFLVSSQYIDDYIGQVPWIEIWGSQANCTARTSPSIIMSTIGAYQPDSCVNFGDGASEMAFARGSCDAASGDLTYALYTDNTCTVSEDIFVEEGMATGECFSFGSRIWGRVTCTPPPSITSRAEVVTYSMESYIYPDLRCQQEPTDIRRLTTAWYPLGVCVHDIGYDPDSDNYVVNFCQETSSGAVEFVRRRYLDPSECVGAVYDQADATVLQLVEGECIDWDGTWTELGSRCGSFELEALGTVGVLMVLVVLGSLALFL